jgi:prefoldin subunit 5
MMEANNQDRLISLLEAQSEQLQAQSEQLQAQSKKLQAQSEQLQALREENNSLKEKLKIVRREMIAREKLDVRSQIGSSIYLKISKNKIF